MAINHDVFLLYCWWFVVVVCFFCSTLLIEAAPSASVSDHNKLFNAYTAPLSVLSAPGNFYFLEFPTTSTSYGGYESQLSPMCGDGSPYSFAFRRGTDEHISKLLIEFENGPACWADKDENGDGDDNGNCCDAFVEDEDEDDGSMNMYRNRKRQTTQTPWHGYLKDWQNTVVARGTFPQLNTCTGVPSGFVGMEAGFILGNSTVDDLPIPLRSRNRNRNRSDDDDDGSSWWETLGGDRTNIQDWSYILLPHCTLDWHLGHQKYPQTITGCNSDGGDGDGDGDGSNSSTNATTTQTQTTDYLYHRGGTNVHAVMDWINKQFPNGLDALITTAGGKVGGCSDGGSTITAPSMVSSIAPAILAANLAASTTRSTTTSPSSPSSSASSVLVVTEGSGMWDTNLPNPEIMLDRWNAIDLPYGSGLVETMEDLIRSSTDSTSFAWMASDENKATEEEKLWLKNQKYALDGRFHVYEPSSTTTEDSTKVETKKDWCPIYAFTGDAHQDVSKFFSNVTKHMSWSSSSSPSSAKTSMKSLQPDEDVASGGSFRLTFLSISIIISVIIVMVWIVYYIVKHNRTQKGKGAPISPIDLWFIALTKYPVIFLFFSLLIPIILSSIAFAQSGNQVKINLDFDSYLEINTDLENVRRGYENAQAYQFESLQTEEDNCKLLNNDDGGGYSNSPVFGSRKTLEEMGFDIQLGREDAPPLHELSSHHQRELNSNLLYYSGGEWISIMYQNRNGGNVFEPDVLKAIHEFEEAIYEFPGFRDYCYGVGRRCLPVDSLVPKFFRNGVVVDDIEAVLRTFLVNQPALWKMDQYFGPENLKSNVTRSFVFLKRFIGADQSAAHPFLESFYRDFLWKKDQGKSAMVHTWNNGYMKGLEANDALLHDTLWSLGSLCFVALMILLKVQSIFVAFFAMLGMILSFSVSYYWVSAHFSIGDITLLWVAGLFVMLGIGADDIFLMVDSFDHTQNEFQDDEAKNDDNNVVDNQETKDALRKRMESAYSRAGSMMLVSTVTTAICFFSNGLGVLVTVQEFGIFMGMVVLVNYVHVMTILPSAILVNEIYVKKYLGRFQKKYSGWLYKETTKNKDPIYSEGNNMEKGSPPDCSNNVPEKKMNFIDRYLVETHIPFISKRSSSLLFFSIILAIILGTVGVVKFAMNDGSIVLFSNKYNLGRLEVVIDLYFNEDIDKTIEKESTIPVDGSSNTDTDDSELVPSPITPVPAPTNDTDAGNYTIVNATIVIDFTDVYEELFANNYTNNSSNDTNNSNDFGSSSSGMTDRGEGSTGAGFGVTEGVGSSGGSISSAGGSIATGSGTTSGGKGSTSISSTNSASNIADGLIPASAVAFSGSNSDADLRRRETIHVNLIWGVESMDDGSNLWTINKGPKVRPSFDGKNEEEPSSSTFDLSEPRMQEWLLEVVLMAKNDTKLYIRQDKLTWIEMLQGFAIEAGVGFPIPKDLFTGYLQLLKDRDDGFATLIENEIGTRGPGLQGDYTYASITMMVDAVQISAASLSLSEIVYKQWSDFSEKVNESTPSDLPQVVAQSRIFLDAYRVEATIGSTVTTWFVANGLCLLVILLFIQNVALSFMVMGTIVLILFCLGGLLFAVFRIPFGPVEALGVSIFIGLSANYSLHVVHAYHYSKSNNRNDKIKEAIFAVGNPIVASALSTMGACAFLFGCRTWVFIELGILICSITFMALLYTMLFLFSWLNIAGPLPLDPNSNNNNLHRWDLKVLCWIPCQKAIVKPQNDNTDTIEMIEHAGEEEAEDYKSVHSIEEEVEVVQDCDDDDEDKDEEKK